LLLARLHYRVQSTEYRLLCSAVLLFPLLKTPGGKTKQRKTKATAQRRQSPFPPLLPCSLARWAKQKRAKRIRGRERDRGRACVRAWPQRGVTQSSGRKCILKETRFLHASMQSCSHAVVRSWSQAAVLACCHGSR
jgi:hypothetical protein